jgi:UDP-glucose 4-epimerase
MTTVLMTGVSSFTGAHIAKVLVDSGLKVRALMARSKSEVQADVMVSSRLRFVGDIDCVWGAPFGSTKFLESLQEGCDFFVNHGAAIKGYRSPDFNWIQSVQESTFHAEKVFSTLKSVGCKRVIHSGSIFEPDEGEETPSPAISIYGVSKKLSWEVLRFYARKSEIPLSKVIIANPIGVFENEDRLVPLFVKTWRAGKSPVVRTPHLVRDNIPAPWLAQAYLEEIQKTVLPHNSASVDVCVRRPGGFRESNVDFVKRISSEFGKRWGTQLSFDVIPQTTAEPVRRVNTEPVSQISQPSQVTAFFDQWVQSFGTT